MPAYPMQTLEMDDGERELATEDRAVVGGGVVGGDLLGGWDVSITERNCSSWTWRCISNSLAGYGTQVG